MLHTLMNRIGARLARTVDDERGDVPGWVLITLMTAGLVVLIWATGRARARRAVRAGHPARLGVLIE